jgi:hypothetical protein
MREKSREILRLIGDQPWRRRGLIRRLRRDRAGLANVLGIGMGCSLLQFFCTSFILVFNFVFEITATRKLLYYKTPWHWLIMASSDVTVLQVADKSRFQMFHCKLGRHPVHHLHRPNSIDVILVPKQVAYAN